MENLRGLIVAAIIIVIVIAGGIFLYSNSSKKESTNSQPSPTEAIQTSTAGAQVITLTPDGFSPSTLTVKVGSRVRWINKSGELGDVDSDPHPVHTSYPPMNFGTFSDGSSVELVFDKVGTYHYHNHLNPSQRGTIVVE